MFKIVFAVLSLSAIIIIAKLLDTRAMLCGTYLDAISILKNPAALLFYCVIWPTVAWYSVRVIYSAVGDKPWVAAITIATMSSAARIIGVWIALDKPPNKYEAVALLLQVIVAFIPIIGNR